jgi:hypothetical protein
MTPPLPAAWSIAMLRPFDLAPRLPFAQCCVHDLRE